MIPNKLLRLLGYNNLSIILEQERRHWLMKTDNNKQIQDADTGAIFQGQLENIGSDIIIESKKLPYNYDFISDIKFGLEDADKILAINNSVFPHSAAVNGFMFARVISTNYPISLTYNHYKIKFDDAEECIIPLGSSMESSEVYADRWIRTTTPPTLMVLDRSTGRYTITRSLTFDSSVTNPVYYYPLTETLQPFELTDLGHGSYELAAVNDDGYIGYPLFWFTCDQSNVGSNLTFDSNNINSRNEQIFFVSNEGNASKFNAKVYTDIDGSFDATPDGTATSNYSISCVCKSGSSFTGDEADFSKPLDPNGIKLVNNTSQTEYSIGFICNDTDVITMTKDIPWEYDSTNTRYVISMTYFDQNCLNGAYATSPLVSIFDVHFDETVPFVKTTTDVGTAGIRMGSANLVSDVYEKYPYNLNKWEGLPVWITELDEGAVPEHLVMYALHQTPTYDPDNPETMQGAGLILDPGKHATDDSEEMDPDTIGRVYVLSNDDIEYHNNAKAEYPKPARTAARICDIPTSVLQLTGAAGLSTTPIIDNKYVRTEASFNEDDKDRLYNTIGSRWVRPTALTENGNPVWSELGFPNKFSFPNEFALTKVDMVYHNDFREWVNLNPMVDCSKVSVRTINSRGTGYAVFDQGECIVGGYAFTYQITEVNASGEVLGVEIIPGQVDQFINIANFDLIDGGNTTEVYGTTKTTGNGEGLKISFVIDYDYFQSILPKQGEFYTDLFAFVRDIDGMYLYTFNINEYSTTVPKAGKWTKIVKLSEFEVTSTVKSQGGVATSEAYLNSMIPSVRSLPVSMKENHTTPSSLLTLQTASFVNIIDKDKTPVLPENTSTDDIHDTNIVDMCKFYCNGFLELQAKNKNVDGVKDALIEANALRYDSYVLWKWVDPYDNKNLNFIYGVVYRSFNNSFTTDTKTTIPTNKLECDNYVNTNGNTTIVWDVPGVGVMMWVYDPTSTEKENYYIDPETMDLHVSRESMTYDKIDVRNGGDYPSIIADDGTFAYNVMTNNPAEIEVTARTPIYQQPEMTPNGNNIGDSAEDKTLFGNWKLVFPRVSSYRLKNDLTNTEWIPKKMQVIKGRSITNVGAVYDSAGNDVSTKSLIVDEGEDGIHLRMFNSSKKTWEEV